MLLLLELSCEGGIGVGFCGVAGMDVAAGVWAVRIAGLVVPMVSEACVGLSIFSFCTGSCVVVNILVVGCCRIRGFRAR